MTSVREALSDAGRRFLDARIPNPNRDARKLMEAALGIEPGRLSLHHEDTLGPEAARKFDRMVEERMKRRPVAQILGTRAFYGRDFRVTPDVLDPRPETETLVGLALREPFRRVLDLGTGSGCILVTLLAERPEADGVGCDLSDKALLVAGENAARHGVDGRIVLTPSDWFADLGGRYDLIVSNPPYIAAGEMGDLDPEVREFEPRLALTDEADGLTAYRKIAAGAPGHLTPGGRLLVEIGPVQGEAVGALFHAAGLEEVHVHPDLDGRDRVVSARAPKG